MSKQKIYFVIGAIVLAVILLVAASYIRKSDNKVNSPTEQKAEEIPAKTYSFNGKVTKVESNLLTLEVLVPGVNPAGVAMVTKQSKRVMVNSGTIMFRRGAAASAPALTVKDFKIGSEVSVHSFSDAQKVAEVTASKIELIK